MTDDNIIRVPPRRIRVYHRGMHGWVEYHPGTKTWTYSLKAQLITKYTGEYPTQDEAALELKRTIDILTQGGTSMRSVD